ncbi:Gp138 family membrane-puncturing spike protein [Pragia fontium]|uniref:Phage protein Gp138 N-terminal domain-containing protein n=1 Tax=Pragia fontium DSM 5563 = ATCC 49100 TaxID=1122977 RepID=A0AAJ5BH87_9GAMM|nr:Gp138 family membrane-puncturing spike protein [Pragia fontium]SFC86306.1 hypothetical protein SAMN02745723_10522 [Pragia fontium DSM 5563 = ATCC 49100]SUB83213.1 phage baseplate assembly protein V [Pragia fontium]VEJ56108.1 phage baseplate assembly protein V [Pragia fontium]
MSELSTSMPSQDNAIASTIKATLLQIHTAFPGKVVAFNPALQTAQIQPMIDQVLIDDTVISLPVLLDVPVQFPRAGEFALTFPVKPGDEGQVIINERCIDGWFQSGDHSKPLDYRLFDLSDASFIPGISSVPKAIPAFDMDCIAIRKVDNSAYVKIDDSGSIEVDGQQMIIKCPLFVEQLLTYQGGMAGSGGSGGASASISGTVKVAGDVIANGVSLTNHSHPGDSGGTTGAPNAS